MSKSKLQKKIEELLFKYIVRFIRYSRFSHIPEERKEIIVGTFQYLLDENDLVPDNVPNIGYLDDLAVFLCAAEYFIQDGQGIPGVCSVEEVKEDLEFLKKNEGLLYGNQAISLPVIRKKGKALKDIDLYTLGEKIREKYSHLGKVEV